MDIVATAQATPSLSSLVTALTSANLVTALQGAGPFTVFAPINGAFTKLPSGLVSMANGKLAPTLTLHVVAGPRIFSAAIIAGPPLNVVTLNGDQVNVTVEGGKVYLNGYSSVTVADINCTNGVVHLVDTVIEPNVVSLVDVAVAANLSTLVSVVTAAGLAPTLANVNLKAGFTVLAPSNAAFAALNAANANLFSWVTASKNVASLTQVLLYHVYGGVAGAGAVFSRSLTDNQQITMLNSQTLKVNVGASVTFTDNQMHVATVVTADVAAYNGVAHVIDTVLLPTGLPYPTTDLVAVAQGNAALSSLVTALSNAGLVSALQAPAGPFTVLAPNNDAFAAFPSTYTAAQVKVILTYHVIVGRLYAADLKDGMTLNTLAGQTLSVSIVGSTVKFLGAAGSSTTVLIADVDSSNAAIHVVDTIVIPTNVNPTSPTAQPSPKTGGAAAAALSVAAALAAAGAAALAAL